MKHIVKGGAPHELKQWLESQPTVNGQCINCSYPDMPSDLKRLIKKRLLEEQGWICCYTGIRVSDGSSHIEHFRPQDQSWNHEDVEYVNMMAAHPGAGVRCEFGAVAKADWFDEYLLISPLRPDCEQRFRYTQFGNIRPASDQDVAAKETMSHLRLDHQMLGDMRKQAVEAALFPRNRRLSQAQLRRIADGYCSRDGNRAFPSFCFVVAQAAGEILRKVEHKRKDAARTRG